MQRMPYESSFFRTARTASGPPCGTLSRTTPRPSEWQCSRMSKPPARLRLPKPGPSPPMFFSMGSPCAPAPSRPEADSQASVDPVVASMSRRVIVFWGTSSPGPPYTVVAGPYDPRSAPVAHFAALTRCPTAQSWRFAALLASSGNRGLRSPTAHGQHDCRAAILTVRAFARKAPVATLVDLRPLRVHLLILVLGAMLPGMVLTGVLVWRAFANNRAVAERRLLDSARVDAAALDREFAGAIHVLAGAGHLTHPRQRRSRRVPCRRPAHPVDATGLVYGRPGIARRPAARQHTRALGRSRFGTVVEPDSFHRLLRTRAPTVGVVRRPPDGGAEFVFPIRVPVFRDGDLEVLVVGDRQRRFALTRWSRDSCPRSGRARFSTPTARSRCARAAPRTSSANGRAKRSSSASDRSPETISRETTREGIRRLRGDEPEHLRLDVGDRGADLDPRCTALGLDDGDPHRRRPPDDLRSRRGALRLAPAGGGPRRGRRAPPKPSPRACQSRKPGGTSRRRGGCNGRSRPRHRCSRSAPASATPRSSAPMPRGPKPSRPARRRISSWPSSATSCGIRWPRR